VEDQLRRYIYGLFGTGFVLVWATLGMTTAILAAVACAAGMNAYRIAPLKHRTRELRPQRAPRSSLQTRPLGNETDSGLPLVPDEPSLIISSPGF
jgi:hypothetical protein